MKIRKIKIEKSDLIAEYLPANYSDAFECVFPTEKKISADDIMIAFWTNNPKWVDRLFALRDWLVKPFGLQSGKDRNEELFENAIKNSGSYRFVKVVAKSDNETIINANDSHLKMYFSVKTNKANDKQQKVVVSTIVHFHNWLGRAYFVMIYPFHYFIVSSMIRHSIKRLSGK